MGVELVAYLNDEGVLRRWASTMTHRGTVDAELPNAVHQSGHVRPAPPLSHEVSGNLCGHNAMNPLRVDPRLQLRDVPDCALSNPTRVMSRHMSSWLSLAMAPLMLFAGRLN